MTPVLGPRLHLTSPGGDQNAAPFWDSGLIHFASPGQVFLGPRPTPRVLHCSPLGKQFYGSWPDRFSCRRARPASASLYRPCMQKLCFRPSPLTRNARRRQKHQRLRWMFEVCRHMASTSRLHFCRHAPLTNILAQRVRTRRMITVSLSSWALRLLCPWVPKRGPGGNSLLHFAVTLFCIKNRPPNRDREILIFACLGHSICFQPAAHSEHSVAPYYPASV